MDLIRNITDHELLCLSKHNPGYQFERTPEGMVVVSPTGGDSGWRSGEVFLQLGIWNRQSRRGIVFDSSTGFNLPDGSCRSPDAAWVQRERWESLSSHQRQGFPPLCPDVTFEVRSEFDLLTDLRAKMQVYIRNGARLAVLVDPQAPAVEIYRPAKESERYQGVAAVALDPELPGFSLDIQEIFRG